MDSIGDAYAELLAMIDRAKKARDWPTFARLVRLRMQIMGVLAKVM